MDRKDRLMKQITGLVNTSLPDSVSYWFWMVDKIQINVDVIKVYGSVNTNLADDIERELVVTDKRVAVEFRNDNDSDVREYVTDKDWIVTDKDIDYTVKWRYERATFYITWEERIDGEQCSMSLAVVMEEEGMSFMGIGGGANTMGQILRVLSRVVDETDS